jgi:hypothetical protein
LLLLDIFKIEIMEILRQLAFYATIDRSEDGKSTLLLCSAPDRAEPPPPPGRTTPSLAPDTANDDIPRTTADPNSLRDPPLLSPQAALR